LSVEVESLSVSADPLTGLEIENPQRARIDARAIIGGAAIATAISWVMTSFGAGIGLAAAPAARGGWGAVAVSLAAGIWVLWIAVSSFAAGGYVAARMRRPTPDLSEHERDVSDGAHGLMVWAIGLIVVAYLASPAFSGLAKSSAALGVAAGAAQTAKVDPVAHLVDRLMRGGDTSANPNANANQTALRDDMQRSLGLVVANGTIDPKDKAYLVQQVSARDGLSPADAGAQVDDAVTQLAAVHEKAREDATIVRKAGVILAFLTAASLLVAAVTAWRAAQAGGRHRDQRMDLSHLTTWR
jgi:hypothetical protein